MKTISWDEKKIIRSIQDFYSENGRVPGLKDFRFNRLLPSQRPLYARFGSLGNALVASGYCENQRAFKYSEDDLIDLLRWFAVKINRIPTAGILDAYRKKGIPASVRYFEEFGGWKVALKKIFPDNQIVRVPFSFLPAKVFLPIRRITR